MTFFYNLNQKLDEIRATPEVKSGQLNERANSPVDEGRLGDMARKVGGAVKKVAGKALDTLGHGSDEDMIRDLQRKSGVPQTGKKPSELAKATGPEGAANRAASVDQQAEYDRIRGYGESTSGSVMTPKQKSFAKLAPPTDKITFADKIAGAKKEVDEMLGDVAAEAMKKALGGGRGRNAEMEEEASQNNAFTAHKRPKVEKPAVGTVTHGRKHDVEEIPGGRRVTRRVDPSGISVGADDEAAQSGEKRGRGRPKKAGGPAQERVTANSRKADRTRFQSKKTNEGADHGQAQQIYDDLADIRAAAKQAQRGGEFPQGFASRLESVLYAAMTLIKNQQSGDAQVREEELDEKAVSKKQQKFMGMVHAAQKGEKAPSKEVAKVAKSMGKKDAEDFAATKHKGLPEKAKSDDAPKKKKEKTEEAGGSGTPTASSGFSYGQGIYDSLNRDLEDMIAESMQDLRESMSINMSMNNDGDMHGGASKSLTVTATDEDAVTLGQLLKSAGLGGGESEGGCGCGSSPCSCGSNAEVVDENQPDWPTDTEQAQDNFGYSGGLNKPKSTGQTTVPVIASQDERQESYAAEEEDAIKRMMEMAGVKKKEVEEEKTEEGNLFTGNLAKARADGKKEADLDGDGDMEKVDESIFAMTAKLWKTYKG